MNPESGWHWLALGIVITVLIIAMIMLGPWVGKWYTEYSNWVACHDAVSPLSDHCWAWKHGFLQ